MESELERVSKLGTDHRLGEPPGSEFEPEEEKFLSELASPPFKLNKPPKLPSEDYNKYDFEARLEEPQPLEEMLLSPSEEPVTEEDLQL